MRSSRALRRLTAGAAAVGALLLVGLAIPQSAEALPGISDCKEAPTPEVPGRGVVGFFDSAPEKLPPPGDPFAKNPTTTIYEQYGYAGLRWNTYDLGCGPDLARSPDATVGTSISNWVMTLPKTGIAVTGALLSAAYEPSFLGVFDRLIGRVTDGLRAAIFDQWFALVLGAMGILMFWKARKMALASSAGAIAWAFLIMLIATVIFRWPVEAGQAADKTVIATMGTVSSALNSDEGGPGRRLNAAEQATSNLHEALLYQAWLGGTFGGTNTEVARKYGPAIFDSQALTWRETAILKQDPERGEEIIKAKREKFEATAAKIKEEDPDAYEYLVGRRSDTRVGYSLLSMLAVACATPFLILSSLLILGALIITRFGVMLFPAFATLGLFPTMRGLIIGLGNTVAAALINSVIFGLGTAVMVKAMGIVMSPETGLPAWLVVALLLLLTLVMWVALKPFRRLTQMVTPGHNHFADAAGSVSQAGRNTASIGSRVVGAAAASYLGNVAALRSRPEVEVTNAQTHRAEADTTWATPLALGSGRNTTWGDGRGGFADEPAVEVFVAGQSPGRDLGWPGQPAALPAEPAAAAAGRAIGPGRSPDGGAYSLAMDGGRSPLPSAGRPGALDGDVAARQLERTEHTSAVSASSSAGQVGGRDGQVGGRAGQVGAAGAGVGAVAAAGIGPGPAASASAGAGGYQQGWDASAARASGMHDAEAVAAAPIEPDEVEGDVVYVVYTPGQDQPVHV